MSEFVDPFREKKLAHTRLIVLHDVAVPPDG